MLTITLDSLPDTLILIILSILFTHVVRPKAFIVNTNIQGEDFMTRPMPCMREGEALSRNN